MRKGCLDMF